ncbi:MAG: hypothetical protein AAF317_18920 [Pseudomonadota bacterium]
MLDLLGTIGGNVLSLPGILGLAVGMTTRNWLLGAGLGALVGVVETVLFAGFSFGDIVMLEFVVAVCVGVAAGAIGSAIRINGTTA